MSKWNGYLLDTTIRNMAKEGDSLIELSIVALNQDKVEGSNLNVVSQKMFNAPFCLLSAANKKKVLLSDEVKPIGSCMTVGEQKKVIKEFEVSGG